MCSDGFCEEESAPIREAADNAVGAQDERASYACDPTAYSAVDAYGGERTAKCWDILFDLSDTARSNLSRLAQAQTKEIHTIRCEDLQLPLTHKASFQTAQIQDEVPSISKLSYTRVSNTTHKFTNLRLSAPASTRRLDASAVRRD